MRYFKRFTDFCAGFAAFICLMHIFGEFMSYNPGTDADMKQKVKQFLDPTHTKDHRAYVILLALLVFSILLGRILERFPYICTALSLLPITQMMIMYNSKKLYEQPELCIFLAALHVMGTVVGSIGRDRVDNKRRAFISANVSGVAISLLGLAVWRKAEKLSELDPNATMDLSHAERAIRAGAAEGMEEILIKISLIILVTVVISLILRDIYFIDVITAAVPFVYTLYLFTTSKLTLFPEAAFMLTLLYLVIRIIVMLSEPMRKKKEAPTTKA